MALADDESETAETVVRAAIFAYRHRDMETVNQILKRGVHGNRITPAELFEEIVMQTGGDV